VSMFGLRGGGKVTRDSEEFGPILAALIGKRFERTVACNCLKLRFGTEKDPRGTHYLWLDPPWELYLADELLTTSADYDEETFVEWSRLFAPLDINVLVSWATDCDGSVEFCFQGNYRLYLPFCGDERDHDDWYSHWYAVMR